MNISLHTDEIQHLFNHCNINYMLRTYIVYLATSVHRGIGYKHLYKALHICFT